MDKHIWRVLDCKNPKCRCKNLLKYYGPYEGQLEIGEMNTTGFSWGCGDCQQTYRYEIEETLLELFDFGPPPGWKSTFEPDPRLSQPIDPTEIN
jgi:hypothetical protein